MVKLYLIWLIWSRILSIHTLFSCLFYKVAKARRWNLNTPSMSNGHRQHWVVQLWVRYSHCPHYATSDICNAFAALFVMFCRRTPPVPPMRFYQYQSNTSELTHITRLSLSKLCWEYIEVDVKQVFGMDLRALCNIQLYGAYEHTDVRLETTVWCHFIVCFLV